jgi:DeoR/GlpR family transcriptional regulator of sugar metabolism
MNIMDWGSRRRAIISAVETQGTVRVSELARQFGVTEMTIRRDLTELEHEGMVKRVHGGGISVRGRSYEPTLMLRNTVHVTEKKRIAKAAVSLVAEGDFIALDVGTTTLEVARSLVGRRNLTIITPSLWIATVLVNQPDIRLIVPGGIVRPGETSMIGELSHRAFEIFHVDHLFMGVGGIDAAAGLTEYNWDDTLVKQAMLKTAKQVIVVADASKFERIATVKIAALETMNILVTEHCPPPRLAEALVNANVKIVVAD